VEARCPRPPPRLSVAERVAAKRRQQIRTLTVAMVVVLPVGLVAVLLQRDRTRSPALRALGARTLPDQGRQHLKAGQPFTAYNSTPSTSGPHDPHPAPCGVSSQPIPNPVQVHDLEHGVVMVQYRPDLDAGQVRALETLARARSPPMSSSRPTPDCLSRSR
jgi:hypothetical protein